MGKMGGITLIAFWIHHKVLWVYTRGQPETMDILEAKVVETLKKPSTDNSRIFSWKIQ